MNNSRFFLFFFVVLIVAFASCNKLNGNRVLSVHVEDTNGNPVEKIRVYYFDDQDSAQANIGAVKSKRTNESGDLDFRANKGDHIWLAAGHNLSDFKRHIEEVGSVGDEGKDVILILKKHAIIKAKVNRILAGSTQYNLQVRLYKSELDAQGGFDLLESTRTDSSGVARFWGVEKGAKYWVRADAPLSHGVKEVVLENYGETTVKFTLP